MNGSSAKRKQGPQLYEEEDDDSNKHHRAGVQPVVSMPPLGVSWVVKLLVDNREKDRFHINTCFNSVFMQADIHCLVLGDFLFVGQPHGAAIGDSFLLDCIAERKTCNDLASSLIDGRYNEQKKRIRDSGITSKIYIVEGSATEVDKRHASMQGSVLTAMAMCQVEFSLQLVRTRNIDHTIAFLKALHKQVGSRARRAGAARNAGAAISMQDFKERSSKFTPSKVGTIFGYQLRQLIGCSAPAVPAVVDKYPTFAALTNRLLVIDKKDALKEMAGLQKGFGTGRKFGPKFAQNIVNFFTTEF